MENKNDFGTFEEYQLESLKNSEKALVYLIVVLDEFARDHDVESLMHSLQIIAKAQGLKIASNATFEWSLLDQLAELLGLDFSISPIENLSIC